MKLVLKLHHVNQRMIKGNSGEVKLVFGFHHVNLKSDQRESWSGGTRAWASSLEFLNNETSGWPSLWGFKGGGAMSGPLIIIVVDTLCNTSYPHLAQDYAIIDDMELVYDYKETILTRCEVGDKSLPLNYKVHES